MISPVPAAEEDAAKGELGRDIDDLGQKSQGSNQSGLHLKVFHTQGS